MNQIRNYIENNTTDFLLMMGIVILVMVLVLITLIIMQMLSQSKYRKMMKGVKGDNLEDTLMECLKRIKDLKEGQFNNKLDIDILKDYHKKVFNKLSIVKYSPLETYGQNSFIMALLTTSEDGIIMNAINSRDGFYLYAKEIKNGKCELKLSVEEEKCLEKVLGK